MARSRARAAERKQGSRTHDRFSRCARGARRASPRLLEPECHFPGLRRLTRAIQRPDLSPASGGGGSRRRLRWRDV
jgi:hypothetical protein